jgi:hypothetical protein
LAEPPAPGANMTNTVQVPAPTTNVLSLQGSPPAPEPLEGPEVMAPTNFEPALIEYGRAWTNSTNAEFSRTNVIAKWAARGKSFKKPLDTWADFRSHLKILTNQTIFTNITVTIASNVEGIIVVTNIYTNVVSGFATNVVQRLVTSVTGRIVGDRLAPPLSVVSAAPLPSPVPVTIISPLVDADTLDLSSSTRSQTEFALALSFALRYAGLSAQANAFEQFVKSKQFDIRTATSQVAVNAYSGTDGKFGFEVGPRLQALSIQNHKTSKSDEVLTRQSFPALLILALQADISPMLYQTPEMASEGRVRVWEPQVRFTQMRRWTPLKHSFYRDGAFFRMFNAKELLNPPVTETKRLIAAANLNIARGLLTNHSEIFSSTATNAILKRIANLEAQMTGGEGALVLGVNDLFTPSTNAAKFAAVTSAVPGVIIVDTDDSRTTDISVAFIGSGLDQISTNSLTINVVTNLLSDCGAVDTNSLKITRLGQVVRLDASLGISLKATNDFYVMFQLETTNKPSQTVPTWPVRIKLAHHQQPTNTAVLAFSGTNSDATRWGYTVTMPTNASPSQVDVARELIQADIEKNKPTPFDLTNTAVKLLITKKPPAAPEAVGPTK